MHLLCSEENLQRYLADLLGDKVSIRRLEALGSDTESPPLKGFGYGAPVRVDYQSGQDTHSAVIHTLSPGPFGHEHMADRARILLWEHGAFNALPCHVRAMDVGAIRPDGSLVSLGDATEFFLLTEYAEGKGYFLDLERLLGVQPLSPLDLQRADALCDYLLRIHQVRGDNPALYVRRIRELVGHGECIMGIADSYPEQPDFAVLLEQIELQCVRWRWKLKSRTHRLRQVHGDFHPWNILFRSGCDFSLLDRSRGEFGEPADDVTCLTINYLFFSLQRSGRLEGDFETLFRRFWDRYLDRSGDAEMLEVAPPFFAFRGLVLASPMWYPSLPEPVRQKILRFVQAVLETERFDPASVNRYCGA